LKGYKDGTYGSVMKGVMKGQVVSLNDEQIESIAKFIATTK
ncbi:MAG: cytochrome c, partial [Campylobacterota bacterium]|nr:cytochrome c [Campylobacterota bacterium]